EALKQGRPEEALAVLEDLRRKLAEKLLEGSGGSGMQSILDQATSSAAAISAELARLGRTVHAPPPAVAQAKLQRQQAIAQGTAEAGGPSPSAVSRAAFSETVPWNQRYDAVIRRYFGREP